MSLNFRSWTLGFAACLCAAAPLSAQNSFALSCPTGGNPGATVSCNVTLTLASGTSVDSLDYSLNVTPSASAPTATGIGFSDGLGADDGGGTSTHSSGISNGNVAYYAVGWVGLSPVLTGPTSQLTGTLRFTIPSSAAGGQSYSVAFGSGGGSATYQSNPVSTTSSGAQVVSVASVLTITTTSPLPAATAGTPYSVTIAASGGTPPYTFALGSGWPTGFAIVPSSGKITGTFSASTYTSTTTVSGLAVTVTDSASGTAPQTYSITVNPALSNLSATLAAPTGAPVPTNTISIQGGTPATNGYTWSAPGLAAYGLAITSPTSTGSTSITGTPTTPTNGAVNVPLTITDVNGATFSGNISLTITGPLTITSTQTNLPTGTVTVAYPGTGQAAGATIGASGGTPPYVFSATGLPAGLGIGSSTGAITGTPSAATAGATVVVTVTDHNSATKQQTYTLVVNPQLLISSPATLPGGEQGVAYPSTTVTATGGSGTYSYASTTLPTGLSISSGGIITGTPQVSGTFSITVTATDTNFTFVTASKTYSGVVFAPGVTITSPAAGALASATDGTPYSVTITSSGGTGPYTWSLANSTSLPPGLTATPSLGTASSSTTLTISGTVPLSTPAANTSFTIQVVDSNTSTSPSKTYSIANYLQPVVTAGTLPAATVGNAFTSGSAISLTGGAPAITWTATPLPSGLTISSSGVISGTPGTNSGSPYSVVVKATDGNGASSSATTTLTVHPAIAISPSTLPAGIPGVKYTSTTISATGGSGTGYTFTAAGLPGGLTLTSGGVLSGTVTSTDTAKNYAVTVTATDSILATGTQQYTLTVAPPLVVTAGTLPSATLNVSYSTGSPVSVTGGTPPYTYSATGLPTGLSINTSTGAISGTPTAFAGSPYSVVVTVKDQNGTTSSATVPLTVGLTPLQIITGLLPTGVVGAPYPFTSISVQGGAGSYSFTVTGLPPGLTTDGNGDITGTPTTSTGSPFSVTVKVTDAASNSVSRTYSLAISNVLSIASPTTLPAAALNTAYAPVTVTAGGGLPPYTYTATGLPAGLSIAIATGIISGTPTTAAGTPYSVTVTVTDSSGKTATQTYTLTVNSPLTITGPASLPSGTVGAAYPGATVAVSGGSGVYTYSATGLPSGLTISSTSGAISGTPAAGTAGTDNVVVTVTDSSSNTTTKTYSLTINAGPTTLPVITSVSAATEGQSIIGPNTWLSIYGANFAGATFQDTWTKTIQAETGSAAGTLPIMLDGVSVMVGGVPAYVEFISATQINVLAPNIGLGPVQVTVTTTGGTSNAVTITSQQDSPGIFEWPVAPGGSVNQPVATHSNYTEAAAAGTFPGVTTVPAAPGETIVVWGSGFGPTSPAFPYGVAVPNTPIFETSSNVTVTLNNIPLTVYQSLAFLTAGNAGLFQVAVTLPATLANGSYPLIVTIGSVASPPLMLTVAAAQ